MPAGIILRDKGPQILGTGVKRFHFQALIVAFPFGIVAPCCNTQVCLSELIKSLVDGAAASAYVELAQ